ncbi:MAG: glycosyltransferase family 4 protein [Mucilaginibacter polytrichastri]|nr:glycosyltransferase family 4 protein [Mucilaginibacter polytrichastri]
MRFIPPLFLVSYFLNKALGSQNRFARFVDYRLPALFDRIASLFTQSADISITWAWAGLETIRKMKGKKGIAIVEECGSCNRFQNQLLSAEYARLGLLYETQTPEFIVEMELKEIALADYILCPSNHVAQSFISQGIPKEKCVIIPYGVNLDLFKKVDVPEKRFQILFVGTIGVRKGLVYLFKALEILQGEKGIDCLLIGKVEDAFMPVFQQYRHLFSHIGRVEHHQLSDYYNKASVFVFPSLDEGMAYVQLEAMACGLPVICTPNSGGDSVIEEGEHGYIVPIRDELAIAGRIRQLKNDPENTSRMGLNAAKRAGEFSWDAYGDKLAAFIRSL